MGYYINPKDGSTKEQFLEKHGTKITSDEVRKFDFSSDHLPVCLVDNGPFTAAGIAYDQREAAEFLSPDMRGPQRLRVWCRVSREMLKPYLP